MNKWALETLVSLFYYLCKKQPSLHFLFFHWSSAMYFCFFPLFCFDFFRLFFSLLSLISLSDTFYWLSSHFHCFLSFPFIFFSFFFIFNLSFNLGGIPVSRWFTRDQRTQWHHSKGPKDISVFLSLSFFLFFFLSFSFFLSFFLSSFSSFSLFLSLFLPNLEALRREAIVPKDIQFFQCIDKCVSVKFSMKDGNHQKAPQLSENISMCRLSRMKNPQDDWQRTVSLQPLTNICFWMAE